MPTQKKIAVILSGCGVYDGSEIHEAVLTLWAIEKAGAIYDIFAPDAIQSQVINHLSGDVTTESRNILVESARIARGKITPLHLIKPTLYDAVIFPGGYGVAKNLCTFEFDGTDCSIDPDVEKTILKFHQLNKPIGALCISPVLVAAILNKGNMTIGNDQETAAALQSLGATHTNASHGEVVVDKQNKIVSTPCYMLDATITQVATGAENAVNELIKMME